jgi:hippurate hydrolase
MEQIFGLHNWPQSPEGTFLWRSGDVMAAVGWIDITITGKGSHGAFPHQGVDTVVVASTIVTAQQTIV